MKIHSQDRTVYFSGVPRGDWPPAVDARPLGQPEESSIVVSSNSGDMDVGRTKSPPLVSEKTRGKRPAADELAQKKRKMGATTPHKPGGISLGDNQTTRMRRTTVFDLSDDDEVLMAPPSSTKGPPRSTHAVDQSGRGEEVPEPQTREVPEQQAGEVHAQQTMGVPVGHATEVPSNRRRRTRSSRRRGPRSGRQNRGRPRGSRDLPRKARESTPQLRLGARAGTADSRN